MALQDLQYYIHIKWPILIDVNTHSSQYSSNSVHAQTKSLNNSYTQVHEGSRINYTHVKTPSQSFKHMKMKINASPFPFIHNESLRKYHLGELQHLSYNIQTFEP